MDDRRILSTTRHSSADISRVNFGTVRKGLDPSEVRSYLDNLAREMSLLESRLADMQHQLADAQRRAANPVLDEATLAAALGSQSAAILRSAHEEAGRVTAEAQERATAIFAQAQERATSFVVEAQERAGVIVSEAESTAAHVEEDARNAAQRLIESAKVNGDSLVERAREQGRAIVIQSQEARKAILNDLAVKRKALSFQIDQLRAARDSLHGSIATVRESVEGVLAGLMSSDEGARAAAIDALRNRPTITEPSDEEILATVPLREVPELDVPELVVPEVAVPVKAPKAPKAPKEVAPSSQEHSEVVEGSGADVVEEIFARLRKATLEERGASAPAPKRAAVVAGPTTPASELFERRDKSLEDPMAVLTRKVKRALQDDQNVMIERLRGVNGLITTELEDEFAQRARYAEVARDALRDAAHAGAQFVADESGSAQTLTDFTAVDECAADLAVTIVLALRRRIMAEGNGDGAERANAAYKEWRGARVERLCTDTARRAFNAGVVGASAGRSVRFLVALTDAPCDACALDAAAGERPAGENFPSGQAYPPLHAGCACAVVAL
jgi:DivIVA domain-containing protein